MTVRPGRENRLFCNKKSASPRHRCGSRAQPAGVNSPTQHGCGGLACDAVITHAFPGPSLIYLSTPLLRPPQNIISRITKREERCHCELEAGEADARACGSLFTYVQLCEDPQTSESRAAGLRLPAHSPVRGHKLSAPQPCGSLQEGKALSRGSCLTQARTDTEARTRRCHSSLWWEHRGRERAPSQGCRHPTDNNPEGAQQPAEF